MILGSKRPIQELLEPSELEKAPAKRARNGLLGIFKQVWDMSRTTSSLGSRATGWGQPAPLKAQAISTYDEDFPTLSAAMGKMSVGSQQSQKAPSLPAPQPTSIPTSQPWVPPARRTPMWKAQHDQSVRQNDKALCDALEERGYKLQEEQRIRDAEFKSYKTIVARAQRAEERSDWAAPAVPRDTSLSNLPSRRRENAQLAERDRAYKDHDLTIRRAIENAKRANAAPMPVRPSAEAFANLTNRQLLLDGDLAKRLQKRRRFPDALPLEKEAKVRELLKAPDSQIVSTMPGAEVTGRDIRKLAPGTWLNDEIINFYTVMLNNRSKAYVAELEGLPEADRPPLKKRKYLKVHAFTSFFVTKLKTAGYDGVKRWTKKTDIFTCDAVLMPVNQANTHWTAACINLREKRFEFYDSMGSRNPKLLEMLRNYVKSEHQEKKKAPIDLSDWKDYQLGEDAPQQENAHDCGVFTSQVIECLSRPGAALDYAQENMPYLRRKMIYEIGEQSFLEDEEWE